MLELNKVMLVGRLTRDPDYRSTSSGRAVAQLSVAVNRRSFTPGGQDEVAYIDIETWEKSAEFCKNYLRKGSGVYIEGRLKQDTWQDKESGQNRSKLKVVAERVQFAESKSEAERHGGGSSGGGEQPAPQAAARESNASRSEPRYESGGGETHDDLPF